jgi:hypothetical protein
MLMKCLSLVAICALALPAAALAASKTYDVGAFEEVSVSGGIEVVITVGPTRSVTASTRAEDFDDLRVEVVGRALKIDRPARSWFTGWFSGRPDYQVQVVTPTLRSLAASSGSNVAIKGGPEGDFSVTAASGSDVEIAGVRGGNLKASASSGSDLEIAGTCVSLEAEASSGSDLDAGGLRCENVRVHASSGSDMTVAATRGVTGEASSGSDVRVRGGQTLAMQVKTSSGADVEVTE